MASNDVIQETSQQIVNGQRQTEGVASSILDTIFGSGWQNIIHLAQNGGGGASEASSALGAMFMLFNSAVLVATAIIVTYSISVAVAQTAHEGVPLGKRYSSLWMPIRSATGVAMITPVVGGFSMIQAIVLMMAALSISFADLTFGKLVEWMAKGEPIVQASHVTGMTMGKNVVPQLLEAELCAAYYRDKEGLNVTPKWIEDKSFFSFSRGTPTLVYAIDAGGGFGALFGAKNKTCGKFSIPSMDEASNTLIRAAVDDIRQNLNAVARNLAESRENIDNSMIIASMERWEQLQNDVALVVKADLEGKYKAKLEAFKQASLMEGWIKAGQWYWVLSSLNAEFHNKSTIMVDYEPPTIEQEDPNSTEMGGYMEYKTGLLKHLTNGTQSYAHTPDSADVAALLTGALHDRSDWSSSVQANLVSLLYNSMVVVNGDPVQRLMNLGHAILQGIVIATAASYGISKLAEATPFGKGTKALGAAMNFMGGGDKPSMLGRLFGFFVVLLGIAALVLAFYIPAIPFIVWIMAVVGWLVMLMQSMLAAPIWAAGHALPEGEGLAGNHARQGYMLFLNVMLRPVLLTLGLIMSFLVMWAGAWLVMSGMKVFAAGMITAPDTGPLSYLGGNFISAFIGMVAILLIGTALVVVVIHRAFDIIYEAADEVLAWIGGGKQLGGEAQHVNKTQAIIAGQFSRAEHRATGLAGRLAGGSPQHVANTAAQAAHHAADAGGGGDVHASTDQTKAGSTASSSKDLLHGEAKDHSEGAQGLASASGSSNPANKGANVSTHAAPSAGASAHVHDLVPADSSYKGEASSTAKNDKTQDKHKQYKKIKS